MMVSPEQVVEHSEPERAFGEDHPLEAELAEDRRHDRKASEEHWQAVGLEPADLQAIEAARLEQDGAQALQSLEGDGALGETVLFEDLEQGLGAAARAHSLLPADLPIGVGDRLQLAPRGQFRFLEAALVDRSVGEVAQAEADASHVQGLQHQRLEALADDELGRTAADIHDELLFVRVGQRMCDPDIDQPRLLAPRDHLDREPQCGLGADQKLGRVLRHSQRVGGHRPHRVGGKATEPFVETPQCGHAALLCGVVEIFVDGQTCRESHRLLQPVEWIDLVVHDPSDLQAEAVGTEIYGGNQVFVH